jgi:methyl-accepting chemotaxis protein
MLRKALAKQTAAATREIRQRIDGIQSSSQKTITEIQLAQVFFGVLYLTLM